MGVASNAGGSTKETWRELGRWRWVRWGHPLNWGVIGGENHPLRLGEGVGRGGHPLKWRAWSRGGIQRVDEGSECGDDGG